MEWNLKSTGIVIAIFFIGYIIGLVEAAIKQKRKDKKNVRPEEKVIMDTPAAQPKEIDLLVINRNSSNALEMEVGGETISNKDELSPENKRLLVNLLEEVRPWLETPAPTHVPPKAAIQPEAMNDSQEAGLKKRSLLSALSPKSIPAVPSSSIVSQINKVLQTRLATSSLANQGIHLQEAPTGGVLVFVGLTKYDGIDAVPDPEIKAFIRQAVAEWEGQP